MEDEVANEVLETFLLGEMLIGAGVEGFFFGVVGGASDCAGEEFAGQATNEEARIVEKVAFGGGDVFDRRAVREGGCGVRVLSHRTWRQESLQRGLYGPS